jgi:hypothetical protein
MRDSKYTQPIVTLEGSTQRVMNDPIRSVSYPVTDFVVWFKCMGGLFETHDEAVSWCDRNDFDPDLCITPVPVAVKHPHAYRVIED